MKMEPNTSQENRYWLFYVCVCCFWASDFWWRSV